MNNNPHRAALLRAELDRIIEILLKDYRPEGILLYGSLAQDQVRDWSDIDLIVIKQTNKRFLDRAAEVIALVQPRLGADIAVYTPDEWEDLRENRPFVRTEILGKGKWLYAA